jgi:polysaccharide deacetylase family protein (PEP-CTERM system associated)
MRNAFTVDVEEWFHICGMAGRLSMEEWPRLPSRVVPTTERVLELFDRHRVRATFFVLGWVAEQHPKLVERIRKAGHELGSHGYSHRRVYELGREGLERELARSRLLLGPVAGFRAPEWSINDRSLWALEVLVRAGFRYDSSMTPLRLIGNPSYPETPHRRSTPAGEILEFPPLVEKRLGQNLPLGGGWGLRMSSPQTVLRVIENRNRRGAPVTLFVHPWELDPDPPRVELPWHLRFSHYFRLSGFEKRLDEILAGAEFGPLSEVSCAA